MADGRRSRNPANWLPAVAGTGRVLKLGPVGKAWQPKEVHEKLVNHGNNKASLDNVRVTMGRMADAGQLFQPKPGETLYILPPSDSSPLGDPLLAALGSEISLEHRTNKTFSSDER